MTRSKKVFVSFSLKAKGGALPPSLNPTVAPEK